MVLPLEMGWRKLLFENWPIEPAVMDAHLPEGLEPDVYDGSAWLSVVPFTNVNVRPKGLPAALGIRLPELNVRTYVTRDGVPSVYFFSLDAQGLASVVGARLFHHLPYYYARISLSWDDGRVQFSSRRKHPGARPARYEATYWPTGEPFTAPEDPLGEFLVERYRFYTEAPGGDAPLHRRLTRPVDAVSGHRRGRDRHALCGRRVRPARQRPRVPLQPRARRGRRAEQTRPRGG